MTTKEYTAPEMVGYILKQYGHQAPKILSQVNGWLARGDGVAVYENMEVGSLESGQCRLASFGSAAALLETDSPPDQLPDITGQINWRYRLVGVYRGARVNLPTDDMLGVPAEKNPRIVLYTVAMDNYEPAPRKVECGRLVEYSDANRLGGQPGYLRPTRDSTIPHGCIYVIDDGKTARPYWGGSYRPDTDDNEGFEILSPFPVNPESKTVTDQSGREREIDFTDWMLGPRKCYHLKIQR